MRGKFLFGIGLLASAAAGAGSAGAADIAARPMAPPPAAAPAFISDWAGFYVGINGGGGWGHTSFEPQTFFSNSTGFVSTPFIPPNANSSGGIFGFQFGHNWQWGPVVGGLEIDFDGASIKESSTFFIAGDSFDTFTREAKIDELASARGRLGYVIFPNWLLYGTAGIGWGHFRINATDTFVIPGVFSSLTSTSNFANEFGVVAGVGLEWKFAPNWLLRGEWLHYDFGRTTIEDAAGLSNFNERTTVDVARAALSYKFSP
ncbi:MAG TPA: outer membrane beta-barrel protein [Xanthobacteraceae bacterium]|jgi:outer membrane immunogenic protein|nr:outer membrane beta-barrel protein [Xanthobacteraceae bacterium]